MNVLSTDKRLTIINALLEGNSIRSAERMTGVHRDTITRLMVRIGQGCTRFLHQQVREITARSIQCDEIWTYVFKKQARIIGNENLAGIGDQYVFIGLDSDTKLVISHYVGKRDATAYTFMADLRARVITRPQLTTDGFKPYVNAVDDTFGSDVDYAQLVKLYGEPRERNSESRNRYDPGQVMGAIPMQIMGRPRMAAISTSYVERQNLTIRMSIRRFTRLTNGFSKKLENLKAAVTLHFAHYNFVRIHQTLRVTPAMAANVTDHLWGLEELLNAISN